MAVQLLLHPQLTTLISKTIVKVITLDEYFYQPCIYKFLCLKNTHVYALGKNYFEM
jgi:hypothetical protein